MSKQNLCLAIAVLVLGLTECAPPPKLQLCTLDDSKCLEESAKKYMSIFVSGIPEYGVGSSDPMKIKSINASDGDLLFTLSDVTVVGMKNCDIKNLVRDNVQSKMTLKMQCTATLDGDYILKGSVLVIPIEGKGKIHVDLRSALFNVDFGVVDKMGADGKTHWSIKSFKNTFELKGKSDVIFENLYDGNELLGQAARNVIKENGNDVIKEIGSKAITHIISSVVKNVNHFFKAIPVEDLVL